LLQWPFAMVTSLQLFKPEDVFLLLPKFIAILFHFSSGQIALTSL